jgi:hypothetical protein
MSLASHCEGIAREREPLVSAESGAGGVGPGGRANPSHVSGLNPRQTSGLVNRPRIPAGRAGRAPYGEDREGTAAAAPVSLLRGGRTVFGGEYAAPGCVLGMGLGPSPCVYGSSTGRRVPTRGEVRSGSCLSQVPGGVTVASAVPEGPKHPAEGAPRLSPVAGRSERRSECRSESIRVSIRVNLSGDPGQTDSESRLVCGIEWYSVGR